MFPWLPVMYNANTANWRPGWRICTVHICQKIILNCDLKSLWSIVFLLAWVQTFESAHSTELTNLSDIRQGLLLSLKPPVNNLVKELCILCCPVLEMLCQSMSPRLTKLRSVADSSAAFYLHFSLSFLYFFTFFSQSPF